MLKWLRKGQQFPFSALSKKEKCTVVQKQLKNRNKVQKQGPKTIKNLKKRVKKVTSGQKSKSEVRRMFFELTIQKKYVALMQLEIKLQKTAEIHYI